MLLSREKFELFIIIIIFVFINESFESLEIIQSNSEQSKFSVGLFVFVSIGVIVVLIDESYEFSVYYIKWNIFDLRDVLIIIQNENGLCFLLVIMNILLLKGKVKLELG